MQYTKTVAAALAEVKSTERLAEALATEIPPRTQAEAVKEDRTVLEQLADVRQEIIDAGGKPRHVETLRQYRETALWVMITAEGVNTPGSDLQFRWLEGVSFTAHTEARKAGLSYEEFAGLPVKTVEVIRRTTGRVSQDGSPESVVTRWSPEQKTQAAAILATDPDVVDDPEESEDRLAARREERHGFATADHTGYDTPEAKAAAARELLADPDVAVRAFRDRETRLNIIKAKDQAYAEIEETAKQAHAADPVISEASDAARAARLLARISGATMDLADVARQVSEDRAGLDVDEMIHAAESAEQKAGWLLSVLRGNGSVADEVSAFLEGNGS